MSEGFYTAEQAADRLRFHPKTVRRFIREGRLRATRIGKSYRIMQSDLAAFAGGLPDAAPAAFGARVTSIVDVEGVDSDNAERLARYLPAIRNATEAHADPMALNVVYDREGRRLKIVLAGSPADVAEMLKYIDFHLDQQRQR